MLALCVESSHRRGMGHFFRALTLYARFALHHIPILVLINRHQPSLDILQRRQIPFEVVDLDDFDSDWEEALIRRRGITLWLNDRLDTEKRHATRVKAAGIGLATLDDRGSGAESSDLNIAALAFEDIQMLKGRKVLHGPEYLVLNSKIANFRRIRNQGGRIIVTMGGSDTYGVTIQVAEILRKAGKIATIVLGPGFEHDQLLARVAVGFEVKRSVPSLIEEFSRHDLAITGGGITPFEANASGLPCIVVANEPFEIPAGRYLARLGSSFFAGFRTDIDEQLFSLDLDISAMSCAGLERIPTNGVDKILDELRRLWQKQ